MSIAADPSPRPDLPAPWERLERVAGEVAVSVSYWRRRSQEAEEEVARLRHSLEGLAAADGSEDEIRRLRAENAAQRSRIQQARTRVKVLLKRLGALGIDG
jgi:hypothetical protein